MAHQLVCSWLGLPPDCWPPDHYALLGLTPGESDYARIEEQVHARLMRLRPYQLQHPELVTEAMNRLARAFTCLTDPEAKRAYDTSLKLQPTGEPLTVPAAAEALDPLGWLFGPWSEIGRAVPSARQRDQVQADWLHAPPPPRRRLRRFPRLTGEPGPAGNGEPPPQTPLGVDKSDVDQRAATAPNLWTKRALYRSTCSTRRLLAAWRRAGPFVGDAQWRMTKSKAAHEFIRHLAAIHDHLESFPPVLGQPGQAGYWVASLARQEMVVPLFRALDSEQRASLARDWRDGLAVLEDLRGGLRRQYQTFRKTTWLGRRRRAWATLTARHPLVRLLPWILFIVASAWIVAWALSIWR
jgi:hypothetical protein